jgi:LmbE family N-acetylglucosaminyl deacetylase
VRRILVLAPHPDDETVGLAAMISRERLQGGEIGVLFLTSGVPRERWFWARDDYRTRTACREAEARDAAQRLGFQILGFSSLPSRRLADHLEEARGQTLSAAAHFEASVLWVPTYEGAHQDHDAAHTLASTLEDRIPVFEFAEYNFAGGLVRSNEFPDANGSEIVIELSPDEQALKRELLSLYASEQGNLRHISATRETLRPFKARDYARPAHEGKLFRERFHWVPVRHPRIDFRPTAEVCQKLAAFVSSFS